MLVQSHFIPLNMYQYVLQGSVTPLSRLYCERRYSHAFEKIDKFAWIYVYVLWYSEAYYAVYIFADFFNYAKICTARTFLHSQYIRLLGHGLVITAKTCLGHLAAVDLQDNILSCTR